MRPDLLGILSLDTAFERISGDVGNPDSYPFPAIVSVVQGADSTRIVKDGPPDEALMQQARGLASAMAKGPTRSFSLIRKAMRASLDNDLTAQMAVEAKGQGEAAGTRDFLEGTTAFLEKRMPSFEGR